MNTSLARVLGVTTALLLFVGGANAAVMDGIVEYWKLDGDATAQIDSIHDGTNLGGGTLTYVPGMFGEAVDLNRADSQRIQVGGPESDFDFTGGSVSISAWFTVENFDESWQALVAKGEGSGWRVARRSGDSVMAYAGGSGDIPGSAIGPDVTGGGWHHLAAISEEGVNTRLYVDGQLVATGGEPNIEDRANPMQIGGNPDTGGGQRSWNGNIDDVGVWGRALTKGEVLGIWNGGAGATIDTAVAVEPKDVWTVENIDGSGVDPNNSNFIDLARNPPGSATILTDTAPYVNFGSGNDGQFRNDNGFPEFPFLNELGGDQSSFVQRHTASVFIPTAGPWSLQNQTDDPFYVEIGTDSGSVSWTDTACCNNEQTVLTLDAGWHPIEVIMAEFSGGDHVEFSMAFGEASPGVPLPFDTSTYHLVGDVANGGLRVLVPVPEPSTVVLAALGLLGLGFVGWRRKRG